MTELVVISGKGGTGKTSLTASLAALMSSAEATPVTPALVLADCDVDAADLHLIAEPRLHDRHLFTSGREAIIRPEACIGCGACLAACRFEAVLHESGNDGEARFRIDSTACEGCGVCLRLCPVGAIDFPERRCGEWYVSETRFGPMVHARLGIAAENSGKLVSTVRKEARRIAEQRGIGRILVDGPPGIGCPVIASLTGASLVLAVTEPTLSGRHDLGRILDLAGHFGLAAAVWMNKWDLNPELAGTIEREAERRGARVLGRIRYDRAVTAAQMTGRAVVETSVSPVAEDIRNGWNELCKMMN